MYFYSASYSERHQQFNEFHLVSIGQGLAKKEKNSTEIAIVREKRCDAALNDSDAIRMLLEPVVVATFLAMPDRGATEDLARR